MPHRTRGWVWAGRAAAVAALAGSAVYLSVTGLDQAGKLAGPVGLVIAAAALVAPYLLPVYQAPGSSDPESGARPAAGGVVVFSDHGSVVAQHIGEVTMNAPRPDPPADSGHAATGKYDVTVSGSHHFIVGDGGTIDE